MVDNLCLCIKSLTVYNKVYTKGEEYIFKDIFYGCVYYEIYDKSGEFFIGYLDECKFMYHFECLDKFVYDLDMIFNNLMDGSRG